MFLLIESIRGALGSLRAHRFRAFLTCLGIIVGVGAIVALVSVIQGLSDSVTRMFEGLGSNNLTVTSFTSPDRQLRGEVARLTAEDLGLVRRRVEGISSITPLLFPRLRAGEASRVSFGSKSVYTRVIGTTYEYRKLAQLTPSVGRFLTFSDDVTRRHVAAIGEEVRRDLGLPQNPVGQYIEVSGEWVKIVGVMQPKGETLGFDQDDFVLLPYSTMRSLIGNQRQSNIQILLEVADLRSIGEVRERIRRLLRASHHLEPTEQDDFKVQTPEQLLQQFTSIIRSVTYFTVGMVAISLLVAGIGIMNIMLVSVHERTREIGICKAIGAKRHHILLQFLFEALALSLCGGAVGVVLGCGIGAIISEMLGFAAIGAPMWSIAVSFGFATFVGAAFGILPAARAAALDPVESLRYE